MDLDTDRAADAELAAHREHVPDVQNCLRCQEEHASHPGSLDRRECRICAETHAAECEAMPDLCLFCNPLLGDVVGSLVDGKDPA